MPMPSHAHDLVVGADGFLGRNLEAHLVAGGRVVARIGRADGDLSDWPTVDRLFAAAPKVARIFHVVTRQRTGAVQYGIQGELLAINSRIHLNVLEAWRRHQPQAKLISTGSSCAYPESDAPLREEAYGTGRLHPSVKGYGLAKQVLANGAQCYAEHYGLKHLHCILATLYGPHDHVADDRSHFLGAMLHRAVAEMRAGQTTFSVWGDPGAVREALYVEDQIEAILAADAAFENEILNCAANAPITVGEAAAAILDALDWRATIISPENSFKGASYKVLDSSRFLQRTGWRPRFGLVEGYRRLYELEYAGSGAG
jgi:GDP-L-fucose synthase